MHLPLIVGGRAVNCWDLAAHRSQIRAELAPVVHSVQEEGPGQLHTWPLHDHVLANEELRRAHPGLLVGTPEPLDHLPKGLVQCRDRILDGLERDLVAMMDHAIVEELDQVLVVPNQVFDDSFGAPGLGVGAISSAVLGDRAYDVAEESAVVSQNPLQKGWIAHGDSPSRKRGEGSSTVASIG